MIGRQDAETRIVLVICCLRAHNEAYRAEFFGQGKLHMSGAAVLLHLSKKVVPGKARICRPSPSMVGFIVACWAIMGLRDAAN